MEVCKLKVLIVVGKEYVNGLGVMDKTLPFNQTTPEQRKCAERILINKHGEVTGRVTPGELKELDNDWEKTHPRPKEV